METTLRTRYCHEAPSAQTALDIFKGVWKSSLPMALNLQTGAAKQFFADPRVMWANSVLPGGFAGLEILELGPFEGYDSYLFSKFGAKLVTSIEANNINFLKCLLLKDTLGLRSVHFLHGDSLKYLDNTNSRFDVIWASGVLYHSEQPINLLASIATHTDRIFLWTHFFTSEMLMNANRPYFDSGKNLEQVFQGQAYTLHYRSYLNDAQDLPLHYEGGLQSFSYWMTRRDIERVLRTLGFSSLRYHETGEMEGMPYFGLLAERG